MELSRTPGWVCHLFQTIPLFHQFHSAKLLNVWGDMRHQSFDGAKLHRPLHLAEDDLETILSSASARFMGHVGALKCY